MLEDKILISIVDGPSKFVSLSLVEHFLNRNLVLLAPCHGDPGQSADSPVF